MARLILNRGAEHRVSAGHPWIYRTQVADLKGFSEAGLAVEVVDAGGRYLGQGFYNPRPSLCCRLLTRRDEAIDASFFRRRFPDGTPPRLAEPTAARLEGFDARQDPPGQELVVTEGDCRFGVTPGAGNKTAPYPDQAEDR